MITSIKTSLSTLALLFVILISLSPTLVGAQSNAINEVCRNDSSSSPICQDLQSTEDPVSGEDGLFRSVFNILSIVAGIIAVIIIIVGGVQMMTSDGDPQKFNSARNLMIYAVIGIVIVLFAQAIVSVVIGELIN